MAKNKTQMVAEAEALGIEGADELTKAQLIEALAEPKADIIGTATITTAPAGLSPVEANTVKANTVEAAAVTGYTIAKGKALTTRVGIKQHGDDIDGGCLMGGEAHLKELIDKGFVVPK